MQKVQAYLKMIISTFKEQPLRNTVTTLPFSRKVYSIFMILQKDLLLMSVGALFSSLYYECGLQGKQDWL